MSPAINIGKSIPVEGPAGKIVAIKGIARVPVPAIPLFEKPISTAQKQAIEKVKGEKVKSEI